MLIKTLFSRYFLAKPDVFILPPLLFDFLAKLKHVLDKKMSENLTLFLFSFL